jgi:hypothetical protein
VEATCVRRTTAAGICGVVLGALAGLVLLLGATRASADDAPGAADASPSLDVAHLPPLLTVPGEPVELRYDVYCGGGDEPATEPTAACDASGTVFARAGADGTFEALPLHVDGGAAEGRLVAEVPSAIGHAPEGFTYYARFSQGASTVLVPAGGPDAPQRSLPIEKSIDVRLGRHAFGRTRSPDARVAEAAWGDGVRDVGLEQGRTVPPIGGSSFDVDGTGTVTLLDEAHKRLLSWYPGGGAPSPTALAINGTIADLAIAPDGTAYVLESTGGSPRTSLLRAFHANGSPIASGPTAERASEVRIGADGEALVQDDPSEQWMQAAAGGHVLSPAVQRSSGRAARRVHGGGDVVVLRRGTEIRLALTGANGVRRSWRVASDDAIAEVQLAEPVGNTLVAVARVYSDRQDEFLVLVLGSRGLVRSFTVDNADWAETAPLSRFRLSGSSLYRLGSTPSHVFVDRFDLGVK